jgi:hypothetical protein
LSSSVPPPSRPSNATLSLSLTSSSILPAAIFETIRKGIVSKVNAGSSVAQAAFNLAYSLKKNVPALGGVADSIVFSKVKEQTGGRLRIAMNGGSALSKVRLLLAPLPLLRWYRRSATERETLFSFHSLLKSS